ncbi:MAG: sigma-70 family RNA polymerase sigma factor [Planctomycetota bacterium]
MAASPENGRRDLGMLIPEVYDELRAIAHAYFRRQPRSFTLRPTEIVNEACLHLLRHGPAEWDTPQHFRAIAANKMWQVIIDHLKRRHAQKRGGAGIPKPHDAASTPDGTAARGADTRSAGPAAGHAARKRIPLDIVSIEWGDRVIDLLDLADALNDLAAESRRLHDVVMLHWFGGLTHAEVAHALGVSGSTVEKDFRYALAWLNHRLAPVPATGSPSGGPAE